MTICAAPYCKNNSMHGTKMNIFPKDPNRRAVWIKNANIHSSMIKDRSALCEVCLIKIYYLH